MFTIRKATSADCGLIHKLAWQIFPETYKEILSKEQIEYSNREKTCFTCKRFMCFLIIRAHTAGVSCFAKL